MTQIFSLRRWRSRGWVRGVALFKVGALTLTGAIADAQQTVSRAPARAARTVESRVQDADVPPPAPPSVRVNRQRPRVLAPMTPDDWPTDPSDTDLFRMRAFDEPLVPVGRATMPAENRALAAGLRAYLAAPSAEATASISGMFLTFPSSPWRASVLANIGTVFSQAGYFSRALQSWDEAWRLSKDATDRREREVANYALGQWCDLMVKLGRTRELSARLDEVGARVVGGAAGSKVAEARESLWLLTNQHHDAWSSGVAAVRAWLAATRNAAQLAAPSLDAYHASPDGMSLVELRTLAAGVELQLRPMFRPIGSAPLVAPAIVHLKVGHYSLVEKAEAGKLLLRDQILGTRWISTTAFDDEASGYVLIGQQEAPEGWRAVADSEASVVIGNCAPGAPNPGDPGPEEGDDDNGDGEADDDGDNDEDGESDPDNDGDPDNDDAEDADSGSGDDDPNSCPTGLARYSFHPLTTALRFRDMPVGYEPPVGPMVHFLLSYNSREQQMPQIPTYGHLGPKWQHNWLSYIQEGDGGCTAFGCWNPSVSVHARGAGVEGFDGAPDYTTAFGTDWRSKATLVRASRTPIRYERTLRDGTVEVFALADGAPERQRRVFLTEVIDPQGQRVQLTYDGTFRLVGLTDAIGQVTTIAYEDGADPLRITKVTDPFGRFATFAYTALGQLQSITDVAGMSSAFTYGPDDFIAARTTPYGTTTFRQNSALAWPRFIEAIDPLGGRERLEFHYSNPAIPTTRPASEVPTGFAPANEHLEYYNSYYWDKRAIAHHPDLSKARMTHWLLEGMVSSSLPHSFQRPLESRIWFAYPGQNSVRNVGTTPEPSRIARVLDDGTTQQWQRTYNAKNRVTSRTDPAGRQRTYVYAANELDLLEVRQTSAGGSDLLRRYAGYDVRHRPGTVTDRAGRTTSLTFNAAGQLTTVLNVKGETTTISYDAYRYKTGMSRPAGATTTIAYDSYGRQRTVTGPDGYHTTVDYDALDRPTSRTFPDGTFEQTRYERLDPSAHRDRLGRWTTIVRDALRRPVAVQDALGRTSRIQWCTCGTLDAFVDARGQKTTWERDLRGRVTRRSAADGSTIASYVYEPVGGRLQSVTDAKLQVETLTYNVDNTLQQVTYTNSAIATPGVSYGFDTSYRRVTSIVDGTGTTAIAYHAPGTLGAGLVASVDGPLANDTMTYAYDELGRLATASVNGSANQTTLAYDALGRVTAEANALGTFAFGYDGATSRVSSILYPGGQTSTLTYRPNTGDRRIQTIHHQFVGGSTVSKFDYVHDSAGAVATWTQQAGTSSPAEWRFESDRGERLLTAVKRSTAGTPAVVQRLAYAYDGASNRVTEQIDDNVTTFVNDSLNRLVSTNAGGAVRVAGSVNEPATVTLAGTPATVEGDGRFAGTVEVAPGTSTFAIRATDASGNAREQHYEFDTTASSRTFSYDANGNMIGDGVRTFEWNAKNELVAVNNGVRRTEFTYDWRQRRVRETETLGGVVQSDRRVLWCGTLICEERDGSGSVERRLFTLGEQVGTANHYFTRDHLGSVREVTDGVSALLARYDYDPYGRRTLASGTDWTRVGFTGHRFQANGSLWLTMRRVYDPDLGRWLSTDPIGFEGGTNLYAYALAQPVTLTDPLGLKVINRSKKTIYVKEENSGKTHPVQPGGSYDGDHDGLAAPDVRSCEVYKITDLFDAVVNEDGSVSSGYGLNDWIGGGWKDKKWLDERHRKEDRDWDELFDKARKDRTCP